VTPTRRPSRSRGREGALDDGADADDVAAALARQAEVVDVDDRQVGPPRGDLLDRRGRVRRDARGDLQAGSLEEALVDARVDPGMVGVDEEVQGEVERL